MNKLTYYVDKGTGEYEPFYEYTVPNVGIDELYARQLCTYFIINGQQYKVVSNELDGGEDIIVVKDIGNSARVMDEKTFHGNGLNMEIRRFREEENYKLLSIIPCQTHFDIIRYLLKDIINVTGLGQKQVTSSEIDEDRGVYVLYIKDIGEEEENSFR